MNFGEKISLLRKKNNITQEQLAERLNVSRQSIYKWENNLGYPETDTLISLASLYHCSLDYLLKDDQTEPEDHVEQNNKTFNVTFKVREYTSEKKVFGKPLIQIAKNADAFIAIGRKAKGFIAVGMFARGIFSCGLFSLGVCSIGLFALGLLAVGLFALGAFAVGTVALGLIAIGAIGVGLFSIGSLSVGTFSVGAVSYGAYASLGALSYGDIAISSDAGSAYGNVMSFFKELSTEDREKIIAYLTENVPPILTIFKNLFLNFIS